ncbi:MAG: hypothetical protein MJZ65_06385 [Paludibacteraceae bacterium]|nr:hypothetical protein [Paludibacteraceae bacterium]
MDFTRRKYRELLVALQRSGLSFHLRHDVDKRPQHSLALAQIEHELGVQAVYYFRCVDESNDPEVIRQIAALGHEIGYHYEDMSLCDGNAEQAIQHFEKWLGYFRQFYPVHRICMHGAPTSQYDGKDLWKHYDYRDYGIDYEPYFDEDYTKTFYLTDTGRCWDGYKVSVRDKVSEQEKWNQAGLVFHSTDDIIRWLQQPNPLEKSGLPLQSILITTHPQRWTESKVEWWQEKLTQSLKNLIKRILIWLRK